MTRTGKVYRIIELLDQARKLAFSIGDPELAYFIDMSIIQAVEEQEKNLRLTGEVAAETLRQ